MTLMDAVKEITDSYLKNKEEKQILTCPRCDVITFTGEYCGEHQEQVTKSLMEEEDEKLLGSSTEAGN